ncbi:hypothetical protein PMIN06_010239 [Paraphaeosphaeria minitans]
MRDGQVDSSSGSSRVAYTRGEIFITYASAKRCLPRRDSTIAAKVGLCAVESNRGKRDGQGDISLRHRDGLLRMPEPNIELGSFEGPVAAVVELDGVGEHGGRILGKSS